MNSELHEIIKNASTIYFVCSGNIIRSSFAELYARYRGIQNTKSYGTTYHNTSIHQKSADKLRDIGLDQGTISAFRPTHISRIPNFEKSDLHIVMTSDHKDQLLDLKIPERNIYKITELLDRTHDVADPYFSGNYKQAYETITFAVDQLVEILS